MAMEGDVNGGGGGIGEHTSPSHDGQSAMPGTPSELIAHANALERERANELEREREVSG